MILTNVGTANVLSETGSTDVTSYDVTEAGTFAAHGNTYRVRQIRVYGDTGPMVFAVRVTKTGSDFKSGMGMHFGMIDLRKVSPVVAVEVRSALALAEQFTTITIPGTDHGSTWTVLVPADRAGVVEALSVAIPFGPDHNRGVLDDLTVAFRMGRQGRTDDARYWIDSAAAYAVAVAARR